MSRKSKIRAGLLFGIGMSFFFTLLNLFTNNSYNSKEIIKSILSGLLAGAVSGLGFGVMAGYFNKSKDWLKQRAFYLVTG